MISQIAALSSNYIIGVDNKIPWHYPEDFKYFKKMTTGKSIVMGRKTFESIGKPLPHRENIVLTRDTTWKHEGVSVIHNIQELLLAYKDTDQELMVIGGEAIYTLFLPYSNKLYLTEIKKEVEGDTSFPAYKDWFEETQRDSYEEFDFVIYERNAYQEY